MMIHTRLTTSTSTSRALFRPTSPQQYTQWMNDVLDQKIEAVSPGEAEMALLDEAINKTLAGAGEEIEKGGKASQEVADPTAKKRKMK